MPTAGKKITLEGRLAELEQQLHDQRLRADEELEKTLRLSADWEQEHTKQLLGLVQAVTGMGVFMF